MAYEGASVTEFTMHPAYLVCAAMKQGRDFEYEGDRIVIPLTYLEKRIEALKILNKRAKEIIPCEIEFKDGSIFTSHVL